MDEKVTTYEESDIQVLYGAAAFRKRPGMYIGSTGPRGLHVLVYEIADRPVNGTPAGRAASVDITLTADGGVRVADDVAGEADGPGLEARLTRTGPGTGFRGRDRVLLGGFGVGPAVVNALSRRMTAEVRYDGVRWAQEYARGAAVTPLTETGTTARNGTVITFWPDADIFGSAECSADALEERLRELAFLNPGLDLSLTDRRRPDEARSARMCFPGGTRDFVGFLDGHEAAHSDGHEAAHSPGDTIAFAHEDSRMAGVMALAFRWCDRPGERVRSFANSRATPSGTHVAGFRDGVAAAVSAYARGGGLLAPMDPDVPADRVGEGLTAVVSVKLDRPEFLGAIRERLGNDEARACVARAVREHLGRWLREDSERAAAVVGRIVAGSRTRGVPGPVA
ncbi:MULTISPECIES: DNA gyrase subunit B [unclassified Streptomyces]|uniref:DNA gyrase subunit B n=1 Tax=unclassified Streptomyces TaxID=2593676 RepID=UPI002E807DC7|nr:DNA gyrase subunit B [Streptomyces sp. NBC_00523]WUC98743.1 DNA gyrase subunit B [Streptomyces sp. NBC_00523]